MGYLGRRGAARPLLALCAVLVLAGCRLDTEVHIEMESDGTGTITVTAVADEELAREIPDPDRDLRFDDATAAGWQVDGPTATDDGGLRVVLTHQFGSANEATKLLRSLGGPFGEARLRRQIDGEPGSDEASATNTLDGTLFLDGGYGAFADQALVDAVGGIPFADRLAEHDPADSMSITLEARLPGSATSTNGERDGDTVRWELPLNGSRQPLGLVTRQEADRGSAWAGPVATVALVALIAWAVLVAAFVVYVIARRAAR